MTKKDNHRQVNTWRGEVSITVAGESHVLVPSYRNLAAIEDACGVGLLDIVDRYEQKSLRVSEIAAILGAASEPAISVDTAGELLEKMGLAIAYTHLGRFLASALFPESDDEPASSE